MLHYLLVLFVIAIVAALLGMAGLSATFAGLTKVLLILFAVIFLATLVMGVARRV